MAGEAFPVDYTEWVEAWIEWRDAHRSDLRPTSYRIPGAKNLLADEVLGTWSINGRNVELSAVTMPAFGERPHRTIRFVGITFGTAAGNDHPDQPIVESFEDLERELGIR